MSGTRQISIPNVTPSADGVLRIPIVFNAVGDETLVTFGVRYDESKYAFNYGSMSDVPMSVGQGTSTTGGYYGVSLLGNGATFFPGQHTIYELGLTVLDPNDVSPTITLEGVSARDAGDYELPITSYSPNNGGQGVSMQVDPLPPIGAVIGPDGGITVGHIDPATGTVHVALDKNDTSGLFGLSPLMLLGIAALFLLKK